MNASGQLSQLARVGRGAGGLGGFGAVFGVLAFGAATAFGQTDLTHPWNPANPLPQFITHALVDPADLIAISKYRSCIGHVYVDNYEYSINQSLKNYYLPNAAHGGSNQLMRVYAPTTGIITQVSGDGLPMSAGGTRGYQINLTPDAYPMFGLVIFHINVAPGIVSGAHVTSGDFLGYADTREAVSIDMAVQAIWDAQPLVQNLNPGQPLTRPGFKYVSAFDLMTDSVFAQFAPYGLTDRSAMIVPLAYRQAHTLTNQGNTPDGLDVNEYFVYPPWFVRQPDSLTVLPGTAASFVALGQGATGPFNYQWNRNGVAIPGATSSFFVVPNAQAADMGFYTATVTTLAGTATSAPAILAVLADGQSRLVNVSSRGFVAPGGALTAGFFLRGDGSKSLLVRGVGPALGSFGVTGFLPDPKLEVVPIGGTTALLANDDWVPSDALTTATAATGAFPFPTSTKDAAALIALPSGTGYTVRVSPSGAGGGGIALAEVYDADDPASATRLINVSTLGVTGGNDHVLTVGFSISGPTAKRILARVVGPTLSQFGVPAPLLDPQLVLTPVGFSASVATNSGWSGVGQGDSVQSAGQSVGAFDLPVGSADAGVVVVLPPGDYTVQASSTHARQGNVLVEVYDLDR